MLLMKRQVQPGNEQSCCAVPNSQLKNRTGRTHPQSCESLFLEETFFFFALLDPFDSDSVWMLVCLFGRERHPMRRGTQSEQRATHVRSFSLTVASCCGLFFLLPTLGSISHLTQMGSDSEPQLALRDTLKIV